MALLASLNWGLEVQVFPNLSKQDLSCCVEYVMVVVPSSSGCQRPLAVIIYTGSGGQAQTSIFCWLEQSRGMVFFLKKGCFDEHHWIWGVR